jgi:hypothetical protein
VAVAISHVLISLGKFFHAAEEVSAREILLGVTEIFPSHAEVLGGFTKVVVAAMVMMTMMTMMTMMAVVMVVMVIEQIIQEASDKRSRKSWQQTEHRYSPLSLGMPAPASCRRSGACRRLH